MAALNALRNGSQTGSPYKIQVVRSFSIRLRHTNLGTIDRKPSPVIELGEGGCHRPHCIRTLLKECIVEFEEVD
jgi:hypothetical protein